MPSSKHVVSLPLARLPALAALAALLPATAVVAQSSVGVSPFVSYVPSAAENPLAGMALTFGGTTGLAFRGSGDISISSPQKTSTTAGATTSATAATNRPWAADADAMLFLGGLGSGATVFQRALSPYLFTGIGLTGADSAGVNIVHNGWSYGVGTLLPLGLDADLFGEARWRMSQYVLPTAKNSPESKSELRFGLSFHVGGSQPERRPPRRRRYDDDSYEEARAPAPAPQPAPQVVVVQPAPPPPQTVVVMQPQPQTVIVTEPSRPTMEINVNLPGSITVRRSPPSHSRRVVTYVVQRLGIEHKRKHD